MPPTLANRIHLEPLQQHHAQDLVAYVKECQSKGESVIVAGDFNKVMGDSERGFTKLHSECGLLDAVLEKHGDTNFTTYQRGKSVTDYVSSGSAHLQVHHGSWI